MGISATVLDRASALAVELLSQRGPLRRAELIEAWRDGGIDTSGQRSYHLLWHLAVAGCAVLGPLREGEQLVAVGDSGIASASPRDPDEAAAEIARRYFEGHGPATPDDLRRWANLTAAETRAAVAVARHSLSVVECDGTELLLARSTQDDLASCRRDALGVVVLPGFDELIFGYRDRRATVPPERTGAVLTSNGRGRNTVLHEGRVVATWRRRSAPAGVDVEISELVPLTKSIRVQATRKIDELPTIQA